MSSLLRLFLFGDSLAEEEIAGLGLSPLSDKILASEGQRVRSRVRVTPSGSLLVAHDPEGAENVDHVPGIGPASRTLAGLTPRKAALTALDVGTGCGIQALQLAAHAERVVATDISERALDFARFNAALNSLENIEFRQGSLFEPVEGELFDIVTVNPPFVISPDSAYTFRDSGLSRDEVSRMVVQGAAAHLEDDGIASVLISWLHEKGEPAAPLRSWVDGASCDTWVLCHQSEEPLQYAVRWNEWDRQHGDEVFLESVERWLKYFQVEGAEEIGSGAVILRKRRGQNWFRFDSMPAAPKGETTQHILRVFTANDRLVTLPSDDSLLDQAFGLVDGHLLEQVMLYRNSQYAVEQIRVVLDNGVGLVGSVEPLAIHVLLRLDGETRLGELVDALANELGLDARQLTAAVTTSTKELCGAGFLEWKDSEASRRVAEVV